MDRGSRKGESQEVEIMTGKQKNIALDFRQAKESLERYVEYAALTETVEGAESVLNGRRVIRDMANTIHQLDPNGETRS